MKIEIYSDGSGNTMEGDGGWAYRIIVDDSVVAECSGYLDNATNNVAELYGAVEGLKEAIALTVNKLDTKEYTLYSDSKLVLGYANGSYACKAEHLLPLYIKIRELYTLINLKTVWVKGHSGNTHNEACDKLAKAARKR